MCVCECVCGCVRVCDVLGKFNAFLLFLILHVICIQLHLLPVKIHSHFYLFCVPSPRFYDQSIAERRCRHSVSSRRARARPTLRAHSVPPASQQLQRRQRQRLDQAHPQKAISLQLRYCRTSVPSRRIF